MAPTSRTGGAMVGRTGAPFRDRGTRCRAPAPLHAAVMPAGDSMAALRTPLGGPAISFPPCPSASVTLARAVALAVARRVVVCSPRPLLGRPFDPTGPARPTAAPPAPIRSSRRSSRPRRGRPPDRSTRGATARPTASLARGHGHRGAPLRRRDMGDRGGQRRRSPCSARRSSRPMRCRVLRGRRRGAAQDGIRSTGAEIAGRPAPARRAERRTVQTVVVWADRGERAVHRGHPRRPDRTPSDPGRPRCHGHDSPMLRLGAADGADRQVVAGAERTDGRTAR